LEDSPDLISAPVSFVMDGNGEVVEWTGAAETLFGWTRAEAIGHKLSALIIPEPQREAHEQGLKYFLAVGKGKLLDRVLTLAVVRRDGQEFEAEIHIGAVQDASGYRFPTRARAAVKV
jgi:PAS domain S-box-containing protein